MMSFWALSLDINNETNHSFKQITPYKKVLVLQIHNKTTSLRRYAALWHPNTKTSLIVKEPSFDACYPTAAEWANVPTLIFDTSRLWTRTVTSARGQATDLLPGCSGLGHPRLVGRLDCWSPRPACAPDRGWRGCRIPRHTRALAPRHRSPEEANYTENLDCITDCLFYSVVFFF